MSRHGNRSRSSMAYYALGYAKNVQPSRFKSHIAEPDLAANILQRNPHITKECDIKAINSPQKAEIPSYNSEVNLGRKHAGHMLHNPTVARIVRSKAFAENAHKPSEICADTVKKEQFEIARKESSVSKPAIPVEDKWLYMTSAPKAKHQSGRAEISTEAPDWFKITDKDYIKNADLSQSPGYDGTITLLSRINQWITVTPRSKNRAARLGRHGPFDRSKEGRNLRHVSDLAPAWMQNEHPAAPVIEYKKQPAYPTMRSVSYKQDLKRTFMMEPNTVNKSIYSIGDYRHNVMTSEEAAKYQQPMSHKNKNIWEWKESPDQQRYSKDITGKIGSIHF